MDKLNLHCEKCKKKIAQFDPKTIQLPLIRDMFTGRHESMPPPFRYVADDHRSLEDPTNWVCPQCQRWNPFVGVEVHKNDRTPPERLFVGYDGATQLYFTPGVANDCRCGSIDVDVVEGDDVVDMAEELIGGRDNWFQCDKCSFITHHKPSLKAHKTRTGH